MLLALNAATCNFNLPLVTVGGRSRPLWSRCATDPVRTEGPVPSGRGRLRRSGPPRPGTDRPAGHGKADPSLDPLHAMQFPAPLPVQVRGGRPSPTTLSE
jgi:hypothetical protein